MRDFFRLHKAKDKRESFETSQGEYLNSDNKFFLAGLLFQLLDEEISFPAIISPFSCFEPPHGSRFPPMHEEGKKSNNDGDSHR